MKAEEFEKTEIHYFNAMDRYEFAEAYHKSEIENISYGDKIIEIRNWMIKNKVAIIKRDN